MSSIMLECILLFCSMASVVWLYVYIAAVLFSICLLFANSSAFNIASCSAWLFVNFLLSLNYRVLVFWLDPIIAIPDPTPFCVLLQSV